MVRIMKAILKQYGLAMWKNRAPMPHMEEYEKDTFIAKRLKKIKWENYPELITDPGVNDILDSKFVETLSRMQTCILQVIWVHNPLGDHCHQCSRLASLVIIKDGGHPQTQVADTSCCDTAIHLGSNLRVMMIAPR